MAKLGPLPDAPRCVKVRLIGQYYTAPWVNVMHLQWTGTTPDATALATLATGIRTAWTTNFAPRFITNSGLTSVECTDISSRTGATAVDTLAVNGTNASAGGPASAAACITWKIARRYRGGHPRTYLSGVNASSSANGRTWSSTEITNYGNAATNFRTALEALTAGGNTYKMVNVSYYKTVGGVQQYKTPPDIDVITGSTFHSRIDSMRRRLGKEVS